MGFQDLKGFILGNELEETSVRSKGSFGECLREHGFGQGMSSTDSKQDR